MMMLPLELCPIDDFNPIAQKALLWTAEHLKQENKEWLQHCQTTFLWMIISWLSMVPPGTHMPIFSTSGGALRAFSYMRNNHPSISSVFSVIPIKEHSIHLMKTTVQEVYPGYRLYSRDTTVLFLINPGSVGQSRDGMPGASYIIYNSEKRK